MSNKKSQRKETREQIIARRQKQAANLMDAWNRMLPKISLQGSEQKSGGLVLEFAICAGKLARCNPEYIEPWAVKRRENIILATTKLLNFVKNSDTNKRQQDFYTSLADLLSLQGKHCEAKGIIQQASKSFPEYKKHFFKMAIDNAINLEESPESIIREATRDKTAQEKREYSQACYDYAEDILKYLKKDVPSNKQKMERIRNFLRFLAPRTVEPIPPQTQKSEKGYDLLSRYSICMGARDNITEAVVALKICIQINPAPIYYARLGDILFSNKQADEAKSVVEEGLSKHYENNGLRVVASRLGISF